jgi:uncharacterized protein YndB with AHSA1/START domain
MSAKGLIAKSAIDITASPERVWRALTDAAEIKRYYFGSTVQSSWRPGSPISFAGEWQGRPYEDKGTVLRSEPGKLLEYTHFSPLMGKPDVPENYHTITITLTSLGKQTRVTLEQDNNATEEERAHSEKNWEMMLAGLRRHVEGGP